MSWTKQQLSEIKEAQLQVDVLVPLFQAMKYKDVHVHQGPSEIGKDLVMWKETDISPRVDYAVVVKADKITGKVGGNSGLSVLLTQIQQCVGKDYLDHVTTEPRQIRHVYVVSSKEITKEAIEHIEAALSATRLNLLVEFIDGEKLWEPIEKHMSERTVLYKLAQIKQICDGADPYYRMVPVMNGDTISLTIQPKDPEALKKHPLRFTPYFTFHKTSEGRAKEEELKQSLKDGSQVVITKEFIESLGLPEFVSRFIDPSTMSDYRITIGSLPPFILTKIEMECSDGESVTFDYVLLQRFDEEDGTTIYKNENQLVPWKIELRLDKRSEQFNFNYQLKYEDVNVNWALQGTRFERAMAKGGVLHIKNLETDLPLIVTNVQPGLFEEPNVGWVEILEKLLIIQQKTHILFSAPIDQISIEQVQQIYNVAHILENGRINFLPETYPIKVTGKEFSQELLKYVSLKHFAFAFGREDTAKVLDKEIPLGRAEYKLGKVVLSKEDWEAVKAFDETGLPDNGIDITITPLEGSETVVEFPKWLANGKTSNAANQKPRQTKNSGKRSNNRKNKRRR